MIILARSLLEAYFIILKLNETIAKVIEAKQYELNHRLPKLTIRSPRRDPCFISGVVLQRFGL